MAEEKKKTPEDADKVEEKRLRKIIESGIEVLKHKLGRVPDLSEVQSILEQKPEDPQSVAQAMSQSMPADTSPKKPGGSGKESLDKASDEHEKAQMAAQAAGEPASSAQPEEKMPRIFRLKVLYGMSDGQDGQKKPDPSKILYYQDPESGHTFDCDSGYWHDQPLSITQHLNSRPISYHESDIVSAIANGVMEDDDYSALEKANLLMDNPKKIWKLRKDAESQLAMMEKSEQERMTKALDPEEDSELLPDNDSIASDGSDDYKSGDSEETATLQGFGEESGSNEAAEESWSNKGQSQSDDEDVLIGENILEEILAVAFNQVDQKLEEMVRKIVREELGRGEPNQQTVAPQPEVQLEQPQEELE